MKTSWSSAVCFRRSLIILSIFFKDIRPIQIIYFSFCESYVNNLCLLNNWFIFICYYMVITCSRHSFTILLMSMGAWNCLIALPTILFCADFPGEQNFVMETLWVYFKWFFSSAPCLKSQVMFLISSTWEADRHKVCTNIYFVCGMEGTKISTHWMFLFCSYTKPQLAFSSLSKLPFLTFLPLYGHDV